jgi:hypothetical protein
MYIFSSFFIVHSVMGTFCSSVKNQFFLSGIYSWLVVAPANCSNGVSSFLDFVQSLVVIPIKW